MVQFDRDLSKKYFISIVILISLNRTIQLSLAELDSCIDTLQFQIIQLMNK